MPTLHVVPGYSAGGSMKQAINSSGQDDAVLRWPDDLSCGPIASDEPAQRALWWGDFQELGEEIAGLLTAFWDRLAVTHDRLVVWFARHSASELAFFLAWASRVGNRPYDIVDVTGRQFAIVRGDGTSGLGLPAQAVGNLNPANLASLLGSEQPVTDSVRDAASRRWRRLQQENAPFRIATASGLASAPADCFDALLLAQATTEWQRMARVIGNTMGHNSEPYQQVGDMMLLTRVVALVAAGKLLADGDPWDMRACRVRLAPS